MTHIEILRTYNNWRRDMVGEKTLEDFGITPRMIGEALDAVIKDAERWKWLEGSADGATWEYIGYQADMLRHLHVDAAMAKESRQ